MKPLSYDVGLLGNEIWIFSEDSTLLSHKTVIARELEHPLSVEWFDRCDDFLSDYLTGYNQLPNGDFGGSSEKSLNHWHLDAQPPATGNLDLSPDWHLAEGHTAFLTAPKDAPRPSFISQDKISLLYFEDFDYCFSGYFATHRTDGFVTLTFFDNEQNPLDEQVFHVPYSGERSQGKTLQDYVWVNERLNPPVNTHEAQIKITLGEQHEATPTPDAFLFFTQLFLGLTDEAGEDLKPYLRGIRPLIANARQKKWCLWGKAKIPAYYSGTQLTLEIEQQQHVIKFNPQTSHAIAKKQIANAQIESSAYGIFKIERALSLKSQGLLLIGWRYFLPGQLQSIHLVTAKNYRRVADLNDQLFNLPRPDLPSLYHERYPDITEYIGFICYISIQTQSRISYQIEIVLTSGQIVYVQLPLNKEHNPGLPLIKELLQEIPFPERMNSCLFNLFNDHLGPVIAAIDAAKPVFQPRIQQRQFGTPPIDPKYSVIVPLYGRYDFIRYQLAEFAHDAAFNQVDLIYVIDDPSIIFEVHDYATQYAPIFNLPFRIVWYDHNLGFAGANNIGVHVSQADILVLLNSDVLPQKPGWLSVLNRALIDLPNAGTVAPLLQFADDSVQHAGMQAKQESRLPGFILNTHPGKGLPWQDGNNPKEVAMLTAACLMLRKADYLLVGGLDEGYLIGDFEDSDLCLALRQNGQRLWLVPEAKLWHLERQSQNLQQMAGIRYLITLYNSWRMQQKIQQGRIADPMQLNTMRD